TGRRLPDAHEGSPVVLRDGSAGLVRPVRSPDAPLLADGFARVRAAPRQGRVPGVQKEPTAAELRSLTHRDHPERLGRGPPGRAGRGWDRPAAGGSGGPRGGWRSPHLGWRTGRAGDGARVGGRGCPPAPAGKESNALPPWPARVTGPWPPCPATPAPASSVAG